MHCTPNFCVKAICSFYSFVFKKTHVRVEQYSRSGSIISFHDVLCVLFLYKTLKAQTLCDAIKTWKMILS